MDNNSEAGFAYIDANDEVTVNFPPLRIPIDANGTMALVLSLDGSRPDVIHETIDRYDLRDDNRHFELFNVVTPLGDLVVDEDSFKGDTGLFNGLDPARISFSVRNNSIRPLRAGDNFVLRVILSEDDVYDPTADAGDMILREFDIEGGNGLGAGLLPNENISFDWIQQLRTISREITIYWSILIVLVAGQHFRWRIPLSLPYNLKIKPGIIAKS